MHVHLLQSFVWPRWVCGVVVGMLGHAGVGAATSADLATLFYTPAERQAITAARQTSGGDSQALPTSPQAQVRTQLNGIVQRSGGKATVWLNDTAVPEGTPPVGKIRAQDAVVEGQRLRVGETLDRVSGTRTDIVAPGSVTPQRKP